MNVQAADTPRVADAGPPAAAEAGYRLLVVMRLGDLKAADHLRPLLDCPAVAEVTLVRHAAVALDSPKLRQIIHRSKLDQGVARFRPGRSLRNLVQVYRAGRREARARRVSAVIGFNFTPYGVLAWLIGRAAGVPALGALIGADFNIRLHQRGLRGPLRAVLRRCGRLTIWSDPARQQLIDLGVPARRVVVLPHTVDTEKFRPAPPRPDPRRDAEGELGKPHTPRDPADAGDPGVADIVYTGYLIPRKRVDLLLQALAQLNQHRGRPATLRVVGDGPQRPRLEAMAQSLGVADRVCFAGWTDDVPAALNAGRVYVLLSTSEGLPMAMLEAMSCGLPVVVTDVGGNAEVVRDGENGYVVPVDADPATIAQRLAALLDDAEHYQHCRAGALAVRQTHGYAQTTAVWDRLLRDWLD